MTLVYIAHAVIATWCVYNVAKNVYIAHAVIAIWCVYNFAKNPCQEDFEWLLLAGFNIAMIILELI